MISDSKHQVEDGVVLVKQTGEDLQKILGSVREVATIIGEIASASAEQTTGLEQINIAVSEIDGMTQRNAALVQKSATTANSLLARANDLTKMVDYFKLNA